MNPWYILMSLFFKKLCFFCVKLCKKQTPKVCDLIIIILLLQHRIVYVNFLFMSLKNHFYFKKLQL